MLTVQQAIDLALQHHGAGDLPKAEVIYQQILQADPNQPVALHLLGVIAHQVGKNDIAVDLITRALAIKPKYAEARCNLGLALQGLGKLNEAVSNYRKALAVKPDYPEAHSNLGLALQKLGKLDEAIASFRKALSIKPDYADAHTNLGVALQDLGKLDEAVACYHKALSIKPDFPEVHTNLGVALQDLGMLDEAIASYHKALSIKPDYAKAHSSLAFVLEMANRTEDLRNAITAAKRSCPGHPRVSHGEAYLLKRDGDYAAARAVLEGTEEADANAGFLATRAYLLGDLCDRLNDTEAAFEYFREGNRRCRDTPEAKRAKGRRYLARTDVLAKRFTAEWIKTWRQLDAEESRRDPVFLVGFPRSGTTLLDTILRSHSAIHVVEEITAVDNVRNALGQLSGGDPDGLATINSAQLAELRQIYCTELDKHLEPDDPSAVVIDKLPLNSIEAGIIHRIFPQARFLFVQRHPCDSVLSCFMQDFKITDAMANFLDLGDAARLYDKVMSLWHQYREVLPLKVHTVRYESLIGAFEETLTPALEFLGVGWDDRIRSYTKTALRRTRITTPSYSQVTQPLYTRARGRWERYRRHMEPVLPILLPWARRFGYDE